jgi:predicted MFS family arabinose efflux permease
LAAKAAPTLSRAQLFADQGFLTLSAAFALGLFAQMGLFAHMIARLAPEFGSAGAAAALSLTTACAVVGRTLGGWLLGSHDRRVAAAANFLLQAIGVLLLTLGTTSPILIVGCILFGLGVGNLTSLPPLIAQKDFSAGDVGTVVALVTAINQAVFALAPAVLGALRDATASYAIPFALAALVEVCAAIIVASGQRRSPGSA